MTFLDALIGKGLDLVDQITAEHASRAPQGPPKPYPLDTTGFVTLDGSGNGKLTMGPAKVREHWQIATVSVNAQTPGQATPTFDAVCAVYLGTLSLVGQFLTQTATGSSGDTAQLSGQDIQPGYRLVATWTGGDPGAKAAMHITGTYTIGIPKQ
jgi:hypothetical protein